MNDSTQNRRGGFFVIEGPNKAGKSTTIQILRRLLAEKGHEVLVTREPGGTPEGEMLRPMIKELRGLDNLARLHLIHAARIQHLKRVVVPAVKSGKIVLCDRYYLSTRVYQGNLFAGDTPSEVNEINREIDHLMAGCDQIVLPNASFVLLPSLAVLQVRNQLEGVNDLDVMEGNVAGELEAYEVAFKLEKTRSNALEVVPIQEGTTPENVAEEILRLMETVGGIRSANFFGKGNTMATPNLSDLSEEVLLQNVLKLQRYPSLVGAGFARGFPEGILKANEDARVLPVRGVYFRKEAVWSVENVRSLELTLRPEPDNPYDPFAVAVDIDGTPVGFLPKEVAIDYHGLVADGLCRIAAYWADFEAETPVIFIVLAWSQPVSSVA
jgi:thymidylate kinase